MVYSVLCSDLIVDKTSQAPTYVNVVESIQTDELPLTMNGYYFCISLEFVNPSRSEISMSLILIDPEGSYKAIKAVKIEDVMYEMQRLNFYLDGLEFTSYGKYYLGINVSSGVDATDQVLGLYPIRVLPTENISTAQ